MDYNRKYLKYKLKYVNLKNKIKYGGFLNFSVDADNNKSDQSDQSYKSDESDKVKNYNKFEDKIFINPTLPNAEIKSNILGLDADANPTLPHTVSNIYSSEIDITESPVIYQKIVTEENPTLPKKFVK